MPPGRVHDRAILDALEALSPEAFAGDAWRVTRRGRDPLRGSSTDGRWSPAGEFEVLYTSLERAGAVDEIGFRLSLEPVWPSRLEHEVHQLDVQTSRTLRLANVAELAPMGGDTTKYEGFDYTATQAIAAAAHFLEFDGLVVPSARRAQCLNLVLFLERAADIEVRTTELVDWDTWRRTRRESRRA
jgi:hypothetical protein